MAESEVAIVANPSSEALAAALLTRTASMIVIEIQRAFLVSTAANLTRCRPRTTGSALPHPEFRLLVKFTEPLNICQSIIFLAFANIRSIIIYPPSSGCLDSIGMPLVITPHRGSGSRSFLFGVVRQPTCSISPFGFSALLWVFVGHRAMLASKASLGESTKLGPWVFGTRSTIHMAIR